jgi:hypothetical protein
MWTNNVRDRRSSVVGPYFFNNIIGPHKQEWDRSVQQAFLVSSIIWFSWNIKALFGLRNRPPE